MAEVPWRTLIVSLGLLTVATSWGTCQEGTRGSPLDTLESLTGNSEETPDSTEEIETDRDSFTPATVIAPRGKFILETAYSFLDNRHVADTHSFPEFLLRYGLTDRIELRLGWNADIGGSSSKISGSDGEEDPFAVKRKIDSEYTLSYGLKLRVTDQDDWLPRSILMIQGFTPTGGSPGTSTATGMVSTFAFGWTLPNRWEFDSAIRYGLDSESGKYFNEWAPSAVLRVPLGEKLAVHLEYFGIFDTGKEANAVQHYISPGVRYLITPNLEFGVRVGWGLNDQSAKFFSNVGIGWQF